jgi:lipoate---protein ligase
MNTPNTWRLIPPIEASGQVQMAIDQWLFTQHCLGLHPPTLRFYTWSPAAISLGYHQSKFPESWRELTWNDQPIALIRRPSGGRAVLHQGDLTYAVIASGFATRRAEAYQQICEFLIEGWRSLSIPLQYGNPDRNYIHNPNCFGTATTADLITANGTKLIGSAQVRRDTTILQHGSMRLNPDPALFQKVFGQNLNTIPIAIPQQEIISALTHSAQKSFNIQFISQPLSDDEWHDINALAQTSCHPCLDNSVKRDAQN